MVLIAQISDCHIQADASPLDALANPSDTLAAVVAELNALPVAPDVVLATGDLTNDGTAAQYAELSRVLAPLNIPLLPLPGNHDANDIFCQIFSAQLPASLANGHCSYVVEDYPVRLVGLDASVEGLHHGDFDDERAAWLEDTLAAQSDRPTLVFTHFPPFASGLVFMDISGLRQIERFRAVIAAHPQVRLVATGHLHRTICTTIGTAAVTGCPSTFLQLGLDLRPGRGSFTNEPPGYLLHRWASNCFVTHTATVCASDSFDLSDFATQVIEGATESNDYLPGR
ncbi:MAG TPA: phosphodiesterase [Acidimicrobiia bacterium]|nr:phosphodiesterase [Acidimicrobiia bacterium]HIL45576.1 phosphodiesterase [Acidimicrobiia bacterium]